MKHKDRLRLSELQFEIEEIAWQMFSCIGTDRFSELSKKVWSVIDEKKKIQKIQKG